MQRDMVCFCHNAYITTTIYGSLDSMSTLLHYDASAAVLNIKMAEGMKLKMMMLVIVMFF